MKLISSFFDKFKNNALTELKKRQDICDLIFKTTGQKIELADLNIRNGVLEIKGGQSLKSEIFLKKRLIIGKLSAYKIIDIK